MSDEMARTGCTAVRDRCGPLLEAIHDRDNASLVSHG